MKSDNALRILLIEDDDDYAALVDLHARRSPGFVEKIARAHTLEAAHEVLRHEPCDLVLLDLTLPDSELEQTLGAIPELQERAEAPVVVLTALDSASIARRAAQRGVQDYLSKDPSSLQRLEKAARYAIERHRLQAGLRSAHEELATVNADLQATHLELERSNEELTEFAQLAAHHLQEPLSVAIDMSQAVGAHFEGTLDEHARKTLDFIHGSISRMHRLVRDLLEYGEVGREGLVEDVDCATVVDAVLADTAATIQSKNAIVERDELCLIRGHRTEIRMLFQNLIGNALKFTSPGRSPRIVIRSRRLDSETCAFEVEDNGIGIEEKYQEAIFDAFRRLHSRDEYEGSGIGLASCMRAVQAHGGELTVRSTPGLGSTFTFTLRDRRNHRVPSGRNRAVAAAQ